MQHKAAHLGQCHHNILFPPKANAVYVWMRETERGGGIMVLLVIDVKGLKLNVIRTTRFYSILYMDTME